MLEDCSDEFLRRRVHAEVEDLETGPLEHDHAQVLADVVDVTLHRADHVAADRLCAGFGDEGTQNDESALHGACGDKHLGDEEVAFLEPPADLFEGGDERLEQDVHRIHAQRKSLFGQRLHLWRMAVERVIEQLGANLLFSAHTVPPGVVSRHSKAMSTGVGSA